MLNFISYYCRIIEKGVITLSKYYSIHEFSKQIGVSAQTLRNWDKTGKLKSQRNPYNGYRIYSQTDIENILRTLSNGKKEDISVLPKKNISEYINKVIQGDCLDVMATMPDKSVDMILCDLPYGTTQNKWDSVIDLNRLWSEYTRIIKDNGVIALTSQGVFTARLILSNEDWFKYKIIWIKSKSTNFLNAKKQPLRKHEDICIFYKKQPTYNPQMTQGESYDKGIRKNQFTGSYGDFKPRHVKSDGQRYPNDVLFYEEDNIDDCVYFKTAESEGTVYHPTQKPVELGRYLIRTYTNPGDIILDNACGSGSFLVSALLENRKFIGIEKNEQVMLHKVKPTDYIKVCNDRINEVIARIQDEQKVSDPLNFVSHTAIVF